jgi:urease accessory protein
MLVFTNKTNADKHDYDVELPFELRQRCRFRVTLASGDNIAIMLPRGTTIHDGDVLSNDEGAVLKVLAAKEQVSTFSIADPVLFARACYHLGNRHVPLQIGDGWARYQTDHVLDDMLKQLGISVQHIEASFEPEAGAYHKHHHA